MMIIMLMLMSTEAMITMVIVLTLIRNNEHRNWATAMSSGPFLLDIGDQN